MTWFWAVLAGLSALAFLVTFFHGRGQARKIGELTSRLEAKDAKISELRAALERASKSDPSLLDLLGMYNARD